MEGSARVGLRGYVADGLLAGLLAALSLYVSLAGPGTSWPVVAPSVPFVVLTLASTVPLVWRRRFPVLIFVVVLAAQLVRAGSGAPATPSQQGLLIALYTVVVLGPRRIAFGLLGLVAVLLVISLWADGRSPVDAQFLLTAFVFVAVWAMGITTRTRRDYAAGLEERARHLEVEREVRAAEAAARERLRIGRELHDIVAHHVGLMVVESEVGQVDNADPGPRFRAIGDTGRLALREMRRLVGAWRTQPSTEAVPVADPEPVLGVSALPGLVDRSRQAGLAARLEVSGQQYPLSVGMDLSVYRIVQESLTNVMRHAGPVPVTVRLTYHTDMLEVEVCNRGDAPSRGDEAAIGNGIIGMRERVALFGGEFEAGPIPRGGFRVHARLPREAT
jgi:signal transduction histidine kinase